MERQPLSATEISQATADLSEARQWDRLGDEEPEVVRQSLVLAEQHRQNHDDPGDAFLDGIRWHEAISSERQRRADFAAEMAAMLQPTASVEDDAA